VPAELRRLPRHDGQGDGGGHPHAPREVWPGLRRRHGECARARDHRQRAQAHPQAGRQGGGHALQPRSRDGNAAWGPPLPAVPAKQAAQPPLHPRGAGAVHDHQFHRDRKGPRGAAACQGGQVRAARSRGEALGARGAAKRLHHPSQSARGRLARDARERRGRHHRERSAHRVTRGGQGDLAGDHRQGGHRQGDRGDHRQGARDLPPTWRARCAHVLPRQPALCHLAHVPILTRHVQLHVPQGDLEDEEVERH